MTKRNIHTIISHTILVFFSITALFPFSLVILNSFKTHVEIVRSPISFPLTPTMANFAEAWETGKFSLGFVNSVFLSFCTILVVLFAAILAGYVLAGKRVKGTSFILLYFMMAMTVPIQLFLFPLYFVMANFRLIGSIPAVAVILAAINMPLAVFLMRTFFLRVPKELEEAARIDGASTFHVLGRVMLPMVSPGIITVSVIVGLQSWNEFLLTSTFLQGERSFTATLGFLSMNGTYSSDQGIMMAGAVIMIVPIIVFFISIQKYFIDGLVSGAIKS